MREKRQPQGFDLLDRQCGRGSQNRHPLAGQGAGAEPETSVFGRELAPDPVTMKRGGLCAGPARRW